MSRFLYPGVCTVVIAACQVLSCGGLDAPHNDSPLESAAFFEKIGSSNGSASASGERLLDGKTPLTQTEIDATFGAFADRLLVPPYRNGCNKVEWLFAQGLYSLLSPALGDWWNGPLPRDRAQQVAYWEEFKAELTKKLQALLPILAEHIYQNALNVPRRVMNQEVYLRDIVNDGCIERETVWELSQKVAADYINNIVTAIKWNNPFNSPDGSYHLSCWMLEEFRARGERAFTGDLRITGGVTRCLMQTWTGLGSGTGWRLFK